MWGKFSLKSTLALTDAPWLFPCQNVYTSCYTHSSQPASNLGPLLACQHNATRIAFRRWTDFTCILGYNLSVVQYACVFMCRHVLTTIQQCQKAFILGTLVWEDVPYVHLSSLVRVFAVRTMKPRVLASWL